MSFPKSTPNILGDSQLVGKKPINKSANPSFHKIYKTLSSKGFQGTLGLLKKFWHAGWLYVTTKQIA